MDTPTSYSQEERTWALAVHLSGLAGFVFPFGNIIAPLVIWSMKRDAMPLVNDQGKEALNFQIAFSIYFIVAALLIFAIVGVIIVPILGILYLIFTILAAIKAQEGILYRYPMIFRLVK